MEFCTKSQQGMGDNDKVIGERELENKARASG